VRPPGQVRAGSICRMAASGSGEPIGGGPALSRVYWVCGCTRCLFIDWMRREPGKFPPVRNFLRQRPIRGRELGRRGPHERLPGGGSPAGGSAYRYVLAGTSPEPPMFAGSLDPHRLKGLRVMRLGGLPIAEMKRPQAHEGTPITDVPGAF